MAEATFRVWRGEARNGTPPREMDYQVEVQPGMVVLDAMFEIQRKQAPDLAIRWNCKAAKCGSCSAEINGHPRLMCKTRLDSLDLSRPVVVRPMKAFPWVKDLVTDVSWNYEAYRKIPAFQPRPGADWRLFQTDVDRVQEFRKCIQCFLCQDVCHVLRTHRRHDAFIGPAFLVRAAGLDMHPLDGLSRTRFLKEEAGIGFCNITKCCTEICPEGIRITDNAIIPLKERVVSDFYDPLIRIGRWLRRLLRRPPPQEL